MIKYLISDYENNNYALKVSDKDNNYQMQLEDKGVYQSKGKYIALNFNCLETNDTVNIYSFFKTIKNLKIKNLEIFYCVDDKEYNVFNFEDYNDLKIIKTSYDKRMICKENNNEDEVKFLEKIVFFLE